MTAIRWVIQRCIAGVSPSLVKPQRTTVLVLLCVAAAGCGAASDSSATSQIESSPIDTYFARDEGVEAAEREWQWLVQEQVALCMRRQGFEYDAAIYEPVAPPVETDSERAVRTGYGLADGFLELMATQMSDPNVREVSSLDEEASVEYYRALNGEALATGNFDADPNDRGCVGEAIRELGGEVLADGLTEFRDAYQQKAAEIQSELSEQSDSWTTCMRERGFDSVFSPGDPELQIRSEISVIQASVQRALGLLGNDELSVFLEEQSRDFSPESVPGLDLEELTRIRDSEIALAVADNVCFEDHVRSAYEPRIFALEAELLEDHSDALDAARSLFSE